MKKAYFSKRIYKNTLPKGFVEAISHTLLLFNRAKHFAFQTQVVEVRSGKSKREKSLHLTVKNQFGMNDYFTNSVVQEANALIKPQKELQKMYISTKEEQIKSVKKKIKSTKSRVTTLTKIKHSFIKGKPTFNKTSREQQRGNFLLWNLKRKRIFTIRHISLNISI